MAMISPGSFVGSGLETAFGQLGTVVVTLQGQARRVIAMSNPEGIQVQGISGRLKGGRKVWNLRLILRPDGREDVEVYESPAPNVAGKEWAALTFGASV